MQYPREMYGKGGLTSLREARNLLEKYALPGETLAYINDEEARFLKYMGGAGIPVNSSGVPSYFKKFVKKITKPIAKILDKVVPNEIKPFLPYAAAVLPFMLPTTGFFASTLGRTLAGAGANAFSQLSQEGAEKYGLNPISVGLAGLSGYLSAPGTGTDLAAGKIVGNAPVPDYYGLGTAGTTPITQGMITAGQGIPTSTDLSVLQKAENFARGLGEYGATTFEKGQTAFDKIASGDIMDIKLGDVGDIAKAAGPSVLSAAGDQAYLDAQKALDDYNKQQEAMGQLGVANTEARKAAIRRAMGLSGYTPDEIENTILKFNFANGGRVGYQVGGSIDSYALIQRPDDLGLPGFDDDNLLQNREPTLEEAMARGVIFYDPIAGFQVNPLTGGRMGTGMDPNFIARRAMQAEQDAAARTSPVNVINRGVPSNFLSPNQSMQQELLMRQGAVQTGGTSRSASEGSSGISPLFRINRAIQAEQEAAARVQPKMANGGLMNLRMGGMPAEMDLRKGGFVPLGAKEKADDVPARLSKNEFVFTAKAVRNAGGGDVRKGAKRMYQIMNQLEARA